MATQTVTRRPSRLLLALELPRAGLDAAGLVAVWPLLRRAPRGDGHPVLVLPGFGASDVSTRILRGFLRDRGYHVHAWRLGRNLGPNEATVEGLRSRIAELVARHGRQMSLVGWSLGGIYAREIAWAAPDVVRQVVTLGSPLRMRMGDRRVSNLGDFFETVSSRSGQPRLIDPRPTEDARGALPVPATAVYTRSDGIVPWEYCLEALSPRAECIEVVGSHSGLGHNPAALWVVADRLAQPQGTWRPFEAKGAARWLFPSPSGPA